MICIQIEVLTKALVQTLHDRLMALYDEMQLSKQRLGWLFSQSN